MKHMIRTSSLVLALAVGPVAMAQTPLDQGPAPKHVGLDRPATKVACDAKPGWYWFGMQNNGKCFRTPAKAWRDNQAADAAKKK